MMKKLIMCGMCALTIAGCATQPNSGSVYRSGEAGREQVVRMGVVESVRNVTIDKGENGIGTVAGGALGGLAAGRNIGSGTGALAAGIVGALAGGIAGQRIENSASRQAGVEITVRLDNGQLRAITQDADESFRVGERVRLVSSGRTTRVTH
jgi:outer membrane lipoprotein SlyB